MFPSIILKTYSRFNACLPSGVIGKNINSHSLSFLKPSLWHNSGYILKRSTLTLATDAPLKNKAVGYWLLGCGSMVYVAVALGGITRLTESGLSMVTWKFLGENMPRTEQQWQDEFDLYKQFPEFKTKNQTLTLEEFKWIWRMEYGHRSWGRIFGATFIIPATYFWIKGHFNKELKIRTGVFGALILAQGLMGWYMVKSGLEEDRFKGPSDIARVSQYRLASHLGLALLLYTGFLWSALGILLPAQIPSSVTAVTRKVRMLSHMSKGLVFLTALSGAFVAGLDAGLVYNSFPKMADRWIPDDIFAFSPKLINFTENPTTVQFDHRILGFTTLSMATATWLFARRIPLPGRGRTAAATLAIIAWAQVTLGVSTLLFYVPTPLAAAHQSGSVALMSAAIWLSHELKNIKRLPK